MLKPWMIRKGLTVLAHYIKHPFTMVRPEPDPEWHHHICLPLRLGGSVYEYACPYAKSKSHKPEIDAPCDTCPYLVIIDAPKPNTLRISGCKEFLSNEN